VDETGLDEAMQRQFEEARGGTLFVDDIARLTRPAQVQLHALLVEERMRRNSRTRVRVVAGASRHLDPERASGTFCPALFYRLNLIHVDLM
jgi:DNA-binding NtrC family response regulator